MNHQDVEFNVPFYIDGKQFYFSFHEVEISDKSVNLLPIAVDAALENKERDPIFENSYISRVGNWYLVLTVSDGAMKDCLEVNYKEKDVVLKYLRKLKAEYLNTQNYLEALFKK